MNIKSKHLESEMLSAHLNLVKEKRCQTQLVDILL